MPVRRIIAAIIFCLPAAPAVAELDNLSSNELTAVREAVAPLFEALDLEQLLGVLREEGVKQGATLERDMFPGRGGENWPARVDKIYNLDAMRDIMAWEVYSNLEAVDRNAATMFYVTPFGQKVVELEATARRAMLDPSVEAASNEFLAMLRDDTAPRLDLLEEFVVVNDLMEQNVTAALNSNFAFYSGLNDAGGIGEPRPHGELLEEIWGQEPQIRQDTELWIMSYLAMAFQPLSDEELRRYIDFSRTDEGQNLNIALFKAYDTLYRTISRQIGRAAGEFAAGEDL